MSDLRTALHALRERWSIIPIGREKHPMVYWKEYQQHRVSVDVLDAWIEYRPTGWAVVTGPVSDLFVLDFDGARGLETMRAMTLSPHVLTPSGGAHVYFKWAQGKTIKTMNGPAKPSLSSAFPSMDVKGYAGYALCIGSGYKWQRPHTDLEEPSEALLKSLVSLSEVRSTPGTFQPNGETIDVGGLLLYALYKVESGAGRNNVGFWLACQLRDGGIDYSPATTIMQEFAAKVPDTNTKGVVEPYQLDQAMKSLESAYSQEARI